MTWEPRSKTDEDDDEDDDKDDDKIDDKDDKDDDEKKEDKDGELLLIVVMFPCFSFVQFENANDNLSNTRRP